MTFLKNLGIILLQGLFISLPDKNLDLLVVVSLCFP